MNPDQMERFRRVEAAFDGALEFAPGADREAWLQKQCANDAEMLEEVCQLLEGHEWVRAAAPAAAEELPRFGPWQAIRLLGRGGMGTVYLAERADGAFQMAAAVKVAPLALASQEIEERFRRERQFLASLDHPKVARLIDGGVTGSGLPYLVMEFVDGLSIDRFCDTHELDARARIGMMRQVLEALIYVHGRQVIHRDLKPSNILVDAGGNAKLLDFGTARLVDATGDAALTKTGMYAFTPDFASPEQAQGKALTFASDIYSAGVLLYRLLTGRPPYVMKDYSAVGVADTISHAEPAPSGLDGPLDAIVATALRKTPEERYGSAAEMDADLKRYLEGEPVRARRPRKFARMAMAGAAVLACVAAAWLVFHRSAAPGEASIAVLPFANLSAEPSSKYLSSGFADELTETLSRLKALRVIAPSSVARFEGGEADIREAGRLLHVANVLEGSVAAEGDRVKIAAKLERVSDGRVLWSETYERQASELVAVQSELAAGIARSLKVAGARAAKHVPKPEAHDYVMKARYEEQQLTSDAAAQARADLERAIALDPEYPAAYFDLGVERFNEAVARGSTYQTEEERRSAEQLIHRALALDPELPAAHAMLAELAMQYDWDWNRAERELRLAEAEAPNSSAEQYFGFLLIFRGRFAEADEHIRRFQDLDPFSTPSMLNLATMRNLEGRFAEARESAEKLHAIFPKQLAAQEMIGATYIEEGRTDLALEELRGLKQVFPPAQMYEAMAEARAGRREDALRLMRPFEEKYPNPGCAMQWFALVYALMGDQANTVKWLERSADRHEFQVLNVAVHPVYAAMRNSAGFRALEKRIGLIP